MWPKLKSKADHLWEDRSWEGERVKKRVKREITPKVHPRKKCQGEELGVGNMILGKSGRGSKQIWGLGARSFFYEKLKGKEPVTENIEFSHWVGPSTKEGGELWDRGETGGTSKKEGKKLWAPKADQTHGAEWS